MDVHEIFQCCKTGDISRAEYLVEQKEVDLNVRDRWDSTPLYYACLCGHEDLVKYLLENGAKCEANTFDGERCIYGALTNEIRNILKSYKVLSSQTQRRDLYKEFLRRLLERGDHHDVVFHILGEQFTAHRCVLVARSSYFAEKFDVKWRDKRDIYLSHKRLYPWAFQPVLQYIYTGVLGVDVSIVDDVLTVARHCHLNNLVFKIEQQLLKEEQFAMSKPGVSQVKVLVIEPSERDCNDVQRDLGYLAQQALPPELRNNWVNEELPFPVDTKLSFGDICFKVEGHPFICHQGFLCGRSDYFKAVITDHFAEYGRVTDGMHAVTLYDVNIDTWIQILFYIYQDSCELTEENVFDVLCTADLYLLPGLKRQCANVIAEYLDTENVVDILRSARLFCLPKLENECTQFMADNLDEIVEIDKFKCLVCEDAEAIRERQETDSVEVIDNIRSCITMFVQTFSDISLADEKLALLDSLLEELGIDC